MFQWAWAYLTYHALLDVRVDALLMGKLHSAARPGEPRGARAVRFRLDVLGPLESSR
jgi:hypothetical protein